MSLAYGLGSFEGRDAVFAAVDLYQWEHPGQFPWRTEGEIADFGWCEIGQDAADHHGLTGSQRDSFVRSFVRSAVSKAKNALRGIKGAGKSFT